jgi:hypothetical protein
LDYNIEGGIVIEVFEGRYINKFFLGGNERREEYDRAMGRQGEFVIGDFVMVSWFEAGYWSNGHRTG